MKIYTLLFTSFFLLYPTIGNSFIGWISVWGKNNCRLYCYADYHKLPTDGYNEGYVYNQSHKEAIEAVISACDRDNCKIIIEDVRGYRGNHPGIKQHQQIAAIINPSSTAPLLGLYAHCEEHKIPTFNIEYRFGRNAYIDNLLDPNSILKILIPKENLVTSHDLTTEIQTQ